MEIKKYITADSFGSECPKNWEKIADYLNDKINWMCYLFNDDPKETTDDYWERFCRGELPECPKPVFDD